jgi:hydroxymethylpyrimidine/phosphomethylpyrimidine kinase
MLATASHDIRLDGIKVGVLGSAAHVKHVASFLKRHPAIPVVVDPVLAAKNGKPLLTDDGLRTMVDLIFPHLYLLTPNIDEASRILDRRIRGVDGMKRAAQLLSKLGPKHVLLKGGHLPGEPTDVLFDGTEVVAYRKTRLERTVHGTGCALSSLMLSFIVLGFPVSKAFLEAEKVMEKMLRDSYRIDERGYWYTNLTRTICASAKHGSRTFLAPTLPSS